MAYDFAKEYQRQQAGEIQRQRTTGQYGSEVPIGTRAFGTGPETFASVYAEDVAARLKQRDQAAERATFEEQRRRILGAMQPSTVAAEAAREQAREAGQATLGAARSQMGVAGTQTAALGALGAGQAQQIGMAGAAQVAAEEQQRNALAQAQLAEMLRQQEMQRMALERADYAQVLGAQRAMLPAAQQYAQEFAASEADRQRRAEGAAIGALGTAIETGYGAYKSSEREAERERQAYNAMTEEERRRKYG
jgi:hypothetical protein